ncbi:hypothetical protein BDN72DRAFT_767772 [Pluteus cervinus]|uniref:Uncharacterized protein n=1 Tax=Pluteus cervinus TaxID=181527 RepID=A0ACD3AVB2_9AGAR|nr:hypothetical protein BDN72DRAFT_767772 [Pluteus cervinus]
MDIGYTSQGGVVSPPVVEEHQQEAKEKPKSITSSKQKRRGNLSRKRKLGRFQFQPQLVLENNGSVARDHLASERTFLAYVRTSLSLATTGVGLVQLFTVASQATPPNPISPKVQNFARPLGSTLVLFGFVVLLLGVYRYFVNQTALTQGHITVARISVYAITLILSTIVIIVFAVLVSAQ